MRDDQNNIHDYESAGFNGFFRRTLAGNAGATNLRSLSFNGAQRQLNFDNQQVSGALGDLLKIGSLTLDGKIGRISIFDERNNEVMRLGDLGDE